MATHIEALSARLRVVEEASKRGKNGSGRSNTNQFSVVEQWLETVQRQLNALSISSVSEQMSQLSTGGGGSKATNVTTAGPMHAAESIQQKMSVLQKCIVLLNNEVDRLTNAYRSSEQNQEALDKLVQLVDRHVRTVERAVGMKDVVITDLKTKLSAIESTSYDGTMVWSISDVKTRRREAVNGQSTSVYSPPFYSSRSGKVLVVPLHAINFSHVLPKSLQRKTGFKPLILPQVSDCCAQFFA